MKSIFAAVILSIVCIGAHSEPTPTVRAFMETPVSLLSFGIFKLETELNKRNTGGVSSVSYNWNSNRIKLAFYEDLESAQCKDKPDGFCRRVCTRIFKSLKRSVCLGKNCGFNRFPQYFSHEGYSQGRFSGEKSDEEAAKELIAITEIEVTLNLEAGSKEFICRGPVTDDEPTFKVKELR